MSRYPKTEAAKLREAEYPLRVARDQAQRTHDSITEKCEADIDRAIELGVFPKSERGLQITRLHIRRMDAIFAILERGRK
jgi:hypothetical protein